jgi:hypothetical protein
MKPLNDKTWPPFRRLLRVGPITLDRVGSWRYYDYPRFGWWRHDSGFSLRYRDYVLVIG